MSEVALDATIEDVLSMIPKGGSFNGWLKTGTLRRWLAERKRQSRALAARDALLHRYRADHSLAMDKDRWCPCVLCLEAAELLGVGDGE